MFRELFELLRNSYLSVVFDFAADTASIWMPVLFFYGLLKLWGNYTRTRKILSYEYSLVEIKLPRKVDKSPLAMELFLSGLHQTFGAATWIVRFFEGGHRPWFSFEIASFGGDIHFFIWLRKDVRRTVDSYLYAQYPEAELHEHEDYTTAVNYAAGDFKLYGCEFRLAKPDPYPIKTYVDYGLKDDPKEEFKIDPMTNLLEFLGGLKTGEQVWIQILAQAHRDDQKKPGSLFGKTDLWKDDAKKEVEKIRKAATLSVERSPYPGFPNPTKGQQETIAALERSVDKLPFDVGIRAVYIAPEEKFYASNIGGILGALKQYNSNNLNGFKPTYITGFDWPWEDFRDIRANHRRRVLFEAYRRRSYFHPPYKHKSFVLNTEELATIFHFPGEVAKTPTLRRVDSRKAEPPANLPT